MRNFFNLKISMFL